VKHEITTGAPTALGKQPLFAKLPIQLLGRINGALRCVGVSGLFASATVFGFFLLPDGSGHLFVRQPCTDLRMECQNFADAKSSPGNHTGDDQDVTERHQTTSDIRAVKIEYRTLKHRRIHANPKQKPEPTAGSDQEPENSSRMRKHATPLVLNQKERPTRIFEFRFPALQGTK
jgi:hypothetical protein